MTTVPVTSETTIAKLMRVRPDRVEVRYRDGWLMTVAHMTEVQEARRQLMGRGPYGMLTIIPGDVDFQMNAMQQDHMAVDRVKSRVVATAVMVKAHMIETLVKLYVSSFPQ